VTVHRPGQAPSEQLAGMGITVEPHEQFDNGYRVAAVRSGNLVFVSGQVSASAGEEIKGTVGQDVTVDDALRAARICAVNTLRSVVSLGISVDEIVRVVKVVGMVNAIPGFTQCGYVINAASELYRSAFGDERGAHARSAIVAGLPAGWAVEVEAIFEVASHAE
jgi:enamine deaminase RidA (YjgF/YER057c/UK114 family)